MKIYCGSKNIIGERVKEAMQKSNPPLTQQDLSARLGVLGFSLDRVSISKIEAGGTDLLLIMRWLPSQGH